MTQVVITGVAGFIGSTLAEKLLHDGHNVRGVDSFTNYYPLHIKEKNIEIAKRCEDKLMSAFNG